MKRPGLRLGLLLGGIAGTLALGFWGVRGLWIPARPGTPNTIFKVHDGETLTQVAFGLDAAGLLPKRHFFGPRVVIFWARLHGLDRAVKSGEYELNPGLPPIQLVRTLIAGAVKTYPVTLPEGLRVDQIARRLASAGIIEPQRFLARARDIRFVHSLGIQAKTLEGYLYPETYRFRHDSRPDEILERMVEEFRARWTPRDHERLRSSPMSLHQVVTLASIVEKESAKAEERPLIAAVFLNRLARGIRLQSDPTVIYGLLQTGRGFDGNIRERDLRHDTTYNTYTRSGLPAGPIANPAIESIRAVLGPADVPYLYFVSKNDGTHKFSRTLREHNRAVRLYQKRHRRKPGHAS